MDNSNARSRWAVIRCVDSRLNLAIHHFISMNLHLGITHKYHQVSVHGGPLQMITNLSAMKKLVVDTLVISYGVTKIMIVHHVDCDYPHPIRDDSLKANTSILKHARILLKQTTPELEEVLMVFAHEMDNGEFVCRLVDFGDN